MKLLDKPTDSHPHDNATLVMDTVLLIMRMIRSENRGNRPAGLSVPQFRVLTFLRRNSGSSLSQVADHVGVALSSMSKLVDGLVTRELVTRTTAADDRRRVTLGLTEAGRSALATSRAATLARLTERLAHLSPEEEMQIVQAMELLQMVFRSDEPGDSPLR